MFNKNTIIMFIIIYFTFQLFSQIWGLYLERGIPSGRNYLQNFVTALVLIGLTSLVDGQNIPLGYVQNSSIPVIAVVVFVYIFMFLYCYAKNAIDNMTKKEVANNMNTGKKALMVVISCFYGVLVIIYLGLYIFKNSWDETKYIFLFAPIVLALYFSFYFFKNKNYKNKFVLALYLYPLLFLTSGVGTYASITILYTIFFTSVVCLWGFFGVEWFVGPKDELEGGLSRETCRAYLGIDDESLLKNGKETQTNINTKNINYMYIAMTIIFLSFLVATVFAFVTIKKYVY